MTTFADQFLATWYGTGEDDPFVRLIRTQMDAMAKDRDERMARYALACEQFETLRLPVGGDGLITGVVGAKCECGSGSDEPSGAHSHWCRCWVAA